MASYEFPNNSNDSNTTVNDTSSMKVKIDDTGNPIKVTWANGTPLTKEEMEKFADEIEDSVNELKEKEEEKRKKREELWKDVKQGFSDVTDKVTDVGTDVGEQIGEEVFGNGYFAQSMQSIFGKTLQAISKTLKSISNFLAKTLGHALKWMWNKLAGFFSKTWKLLESIKLFSLIGKLLGGIGSAVKGTLNVGGDLIKSLVSGLLSGGVGAAVSAGLKSLGSALGGITSAALAGAIATAMIAASGYAIGKTANLISDNIDANEVIKEYFEGDGYHQFGSRKVKIPFDVVKDYPGESLKQRDRRINDWLEANQEKSDKSDSVRYEEWLKKWPEVAKDLNFHKPWWGQDKDKNGWKDYSPERWKEFYNAVKYGSQGVDNEWTKDLSPYTKELFLKNKILKNTAGVSST